MYRNHSVGVVVPAYNEEGLIGRVIDTMPGFVDRVYVIDDGSTDGTWEEIQEHASAVNERREVVLADGGHQPTVLPFRNDRNLGRGGSVKFGYREALDDEMDLVAVMDGDGQMDPAILDRMLDPIVEGRADYVKGNRLSGRRSWQGMSRFRLFGNVMLTFLTKVSSGYWSVSDSQNGYSAISRQALERIPVDELYDDYGFLNDILAKCNLQDLRVADVPHSAIYGEEQSTIEYGSFIPRVSLLLFRNFRRRIKLKYLLLDFHPVALCYGLSVVAMLVGLVGWLYTGVTWAQGVFVRGMLSSLVFFVGSLFLVLAFAYDVELNDHLMADAERN
ncbi:glycosyltransferase family 2 protein [Halomarina ordinaria]|uniref:Glycosyltransferase family 2 protein n=1 Tax=Halomarina ordinaria TaxID=3033939 RepID=A0ABD5UGX0_9EURY|nr:glycosyltransferase family 2 protein [Halomarina sp. PSRA2]